MVRQVDRRTVLKGVGGLGVTSVVAGCIGDEEAVDDGDGNGGDGGGGGGPDVVNVIGYPQSGIQIFRDYYSSFEEGTVDFIVPDGLQDPGLVDEVGNDMANVIGTAPASGGPEEDAYVEIFEDEYGESPGVFTSHTFDAVAVAILANIAAGENDGAAVQQQWRNVANPNGDEYGPGELEEAAEAVAAGEAINYQGASSSVDFDENGDPAEATYDVWEFADGGTPATTSVEFEGEGPGGDSADEVPGGSDRDEVSVAILLPETGDLGTTGSPMIDAGEVAAAQFEGVFDIDLAVEDTQTDEETTLSNGEALIDAGYPAIVGAASSGNSVPLVGVTSGSNVVQCSPASTALSLTNVDDDDYFFRTAPSDILQAQVMAEVCADQLGAERAATLYVNNDYGQQLAEEFVRSFEEDQGGEVLNEVSFEMEQGSYTSELESVLAE